MLCWVACPVRSAAAQPVSADARTGLDAERPPRTVDENPFWFPHMPSAGFGLHLGGGLIQFPASVLEREGMGDPSGFAFGLHGLLWRYVFADVGLGWLWAADRRPFLETACDVFSGDCGTSESGIDGFMGWIKVGPQARFFVPIGDDAFELAVLGGIGLKDWGLSRTAKHGGTCSDCRSDNVDADGGAMLSPELDLGYAFGTQADSGGVGLKVVYEHYLAGEAMRGLWFSAFFEGYAW